MPLATSSSAGQAQNRNSPPSPPDHIPTPSLTPVCTTALSACSAASKPCEHSNAAACIPGAPSSSSCSPPKSPPASASAVSVVDSSLERSTPAVPTPCRTKTKVL